MTLSPTPGVGAAVDRLVKAYDADRGRLMDIVLAVQRDFGAVGDAAVAAIAAGVGLRPADARRWSPARSGRGPEGFRRRPALREGADA